VVPIGITYHTVRPASFGYLPKGWSTLPNTPIMLDRQGTSAEAMALSWRYTPGPTGPAGVLPRNGLMVWVLLLRSGSTTVNLCRTTPRFSDHPARTFPLQLPRTTSQTLEGSPSVKEYRVFGRYADYYNFEVRVDIAPHAFPHAWQLATRVVAGIQFPTWPSLATC
jgi:hypothetical protein